MAVQQSRSLKDYFILFLKGIGMGSADVVPGVSGGTIAFIAGIYEELVGSINQINLSALQTLRKEGVAAAWKLVNGNFFVVLLSGIATAIISLAKLITHLLDTQPVLIWSFFFGLVFMSIYFVAKRVKQWNISRYASFVIGAAIAFFITTLPAQPESDALWYIFLSGMIAICAMILPGISGSFILLLLGSYSVVLNAIHERNLVIIATFAVGAVIGLLSFSRLLKFMFDRFHDVTIALLSGFLLGSLNKVWPWKQTLTWFTKHAGEANEELVPVEQINILPNTYDSLALGDAQLGWAIALFFVGVAVIVALELFSVNKPEE
jgi:putative membrane protein